MPFPSVMVPSRFFITSIIFVMFCFNMFGQNHGLIAHVISITCFSFLWMSRKVAACVECFQRSFIDFLKAVFHKFYLNIFEYLDSYEPPHQKQNFPPLQSFHWLFLGNKFLVANTNIYRGGLVLGVVDCFLFF